MYLGGVKAATAQQDYLLLEATVFFHALSNGNAQSIHALLQGQSLRTELPRTVAARVPARYAFAVKV